MSLPVNEDQFNAWKHDPVTQTVMAALERQVSEQKELWSDGQFVGQPAREAGVLGYIKAYRGLFDLDYQQLQEAFE